MFSPLTFTASLRKQNVVSEWALEKKVELVTTGVKITKQTCFTWTTFRLSVLFAIRQNSYIYLWLLRHFAYV